MRRLARRRREVLNLDENVMVKICDMGNGLLDLSPLTN